MVIIESGRGQIPFTGTCCAIGFFDGVHIAHQRLIAAALAYPGKSAVLTFANSPASFVKSRSAPDQILSLEDKIDIFASMGIDCLFLYAFDQAMMEMAPESFVAQAIEANGIKKAVVGYNFRFGKDSSADASELGRLCALRGIEAESVPAVYFAGDPVSSSLVRKKLYHGQIQEANALLGRNFFIKGIVEQGKRLGRKIGFPTINTYVPPSLLVPKWGVYETYTTIEGERRHSITNVGNNPTVEGDRFGIETHILDFGGDVYGQQAKVEFVALVRGEMKFASLEELSRQIAVDIERVQKSK
ncbi:MAG: bifunctional riboflavin kinase/FAD synthetase [Eubacteriaceae bacterium]|jgi:riboflavin kinase/FMN adenylyltransferase|nr:bifunctional riboflavin kinase/FAD synthetase [Eubacteriaceae bacterium]